MSSMEVNNAHFASALALEVEGAFVILCQRVEALLLARAEPDSPGRFVGKT